MPGQSGPSLGLEDRSPLAAADVRFLVSSIAPDVDSRIESGTPHGRISPAALRIDPDGEPRLAAVPDPEAAELYAAPEVRDGAAPTARSEVFALASTTYTLLTGHPPNPSGVATVRRDRPDLGPEVDGVLLQATARTPDLRFASAADFAAALSEALGAATAKPLPLNPRAERSPESAPPAPAPEPRFVAPAAAAAPPAAPTPPAPAAPPARPTRDEGREESATQVRPATQDRPVPPSRPAARRGLEIPEAALPIVFLLLVVLIAAGCMALFLSGT